MKRKVLLLDIDYTVINIDSMFSFLIYSFRKKFFFTLTKIPTIIIKLFLYIIKIIDIKNAKQAMFSTLVCFTDYDLEDFFKNMIENRINHLIKEKIDLAKKEDALVIMITASPDSYMKYFEKYGYADKVIATNFRNDKGKYYNEILGENCKGLEKVLRLKEYLTENDIEIDYENSFAYSDSKSDLPILNLVKNAYLVSKKDGSILSKV